MMRETGAVAPVHVSEDPARSMTAEIVDRAAQLDTQWAAALTAGENLVEALRGRRAPNVDDLATIDSLTSTVHTLAQRLATVTGRDVAASHAEIEEAVQRLRVAADGDWLHQLRRLTGPDDLAAEIAVLRDEVDHCLLDASPPRHTGLRALYDLVAGNGESGQGYDLALAAQAGLPVHLHRLVLAAIQGVVGLPSDQIAAGPRPTTDLPTQQPAVDSQRPGRTEDQAALPAPRGDSAPTPNGAADVVPVGDSGWGYVVPGSALAPVAAEPAFLAGVTDEWDVAEVVTVPTDPHPAIDPSTAFPVELVAQIERADAGLLEQGRYGLAAGLVEAAGQPYAAGVARRLAAYASGMRSSAGPLAAAFGQVAGPLTRAAFADDRASQLLAWAACMRATATAHVPEAVPAMDDLTMTMENYPGLLALGRSMTDAARGGVVVAPELGADLAEGRLVEEQVADCAARAGELISTAHTRSSQYAPAAMVYREWLGDRGNLGVLLRLVGGNDPASLEEVQQRILAGRGHADREIDKGFARIQARRELRVGRRIKDGARQWLKKRYQEALDISAAWAAATGRVLVLQDRARGAPAAHRVNRLRRSVNDCRAQVWLDLDRLLAEHTDRGPGLAAAATAVRRLLTEMFDCFDGRYPAGREMSPEYVIGGEVLASDLLVDAATLLPQDGLAIGHADQLLHVAASSPADLTDLYRTRAALGDHDLADVVMEILREVDAASAEVVDMRREAEVTAARAMTERMVRQLERRIDQARMSGVLDEATWSSLAADLQHLADPQRRDFRRIRHEADRLDDTLAAARDNAIRRTLTAIDQAARTNPAVGEHAGRLADMARCGEIAGADEYLEQLRAGHAIPAENEQDGHFGRFFPTVPDLVARYPRLLDDLRLALLGDTDRRTSVAGLAAATGVDPGRLTPHRRDAGVRAIDAWHALEQRKLGEYGLDTPRALADVLGHLGVEFKRPGRVEDQARGRRWRRWVTLHEVNASGRVASPVLGSEMSPDGGTLRVLIAHSPSSPTQLVESLRDERDDHTVLVVWLGSALTTSDRRALAAAAHGRPRPAVLVLDAAALAYLLLQPEPLRGPFVDIAAPFSAANPYQDKAGDAAEEMFVGRTEELAAVMDLRGPCVLYGGRQLGKSALLRAAQRGFVRRNPAGCAVYVNIYPVGADGLADRLWPELWRRLADKDVLPAVMPAHGDLAQWVYDGIRAWLREDPARTLLVLLDEADAFLEADATATSGRANDAFRQVDWCRRIMQDDGMDRRVKIVFAGLHRTARFSSVSNQPLEHLGTPILIGPLRPQPAHELATRPLATLGFQFADPHATPARIMAYTNNIPALLQIFGRALVAHLFRRASTAHEPPGVVTDDDVDAVITDVALREQLINKYNLTLELDPRYKVIAHVAALAAHEEPGASLSVNMIAEQCRQYWPAGFANSGLDTLQSLVDECVDLGVLAKARSRYRVRTPTVLRLLGDQETVLETLIYAPEQLKVPTPSSRMSFRRKLSEESGWRSPLTEQQISLLASRTGLRVIVGSQALGIQYVGKLLEEVKEHLKVGEIRRLQRPTPDQVHRALDRNGRSLLILDTCGMAPNEVRGILAAVRPDGAATARDTGGAVVAVADVSSTPAWADFPDRVDLRRLDGVGLRLWCDEEDLPFRDDRERTALAGATGGWPHLTAWLTSRFRSQEAANSEALLSWFATWWRRHGAGDLLRQAGLADNQPLPQVLLAAARTLDVIGPVASSERPVLIEMLEEHGHAARAAGFTGPRQIFDALQVLGIIDATAEAIRIEPVFADAMRMSRTSAHMPDGLSS